VDYTGIKLFNTHPYNIKIFRPDVKVFKPTLKKYPQACCSVEQYTAVDGLYEMYISIKIHFNEKNIVICVYFFSYNCDIIIS
jgi:hypothetical protein